MTADTPTQTTHQKADIQQRHADLERHDRKLRTEALRAVSAQTAPLFKALRDHCGETGHKWKFSSWNWDNSYAWDKCVWCGASEGADKHEATP